mmetsp:Transcript_13805/g.20080  ORF Transcript_13805/g.20080 Transcript_13805/m.20080 type:complete len:159 (+) Transcript_13805:156-632(+)
MRASGAVQEAAAEAGVQRLSLRLCSNASPMDEHIDIWNMCVLQWVDMGARMHGEHETKENEENTIENQEALPCLRQKLATKLSMPYGNYRPHMSLVYAEVDYSTRLRLAEQVTQEFLSAPRQLEFEVDRVIMMETNVSAGPHGVSAWRQVAEIPFVAQ